MSRLRRDLAIAVSAFLLVGAVLLHLTAGRAFVPAWPDAEERVRSTAVGADVLDPEDGTALSGVTLERERTIVPRQSVVNGTGYFLVSTSTETASGDLVGRQRWSGLQDARSGEVVPSPLNAEKTVRLDDSGNEVETNRALQGMAGQLIRFPRDTPKQDVLRWDPETRNATEARFVRTATLRGSEVLEFRQKADLREGARTTRTDTTLWVRPEVGAVVRSRTHILTRLGRGDAATVVMDATFLDDPRDVRVLSQRVDDAVRHQRWLRIYGPAAALIASILTAGVAALEASRARGTRRGRSRVT